MGERARAFPVAAHVQGMTPRPPPTPPEDRGERPLTTQALYDEHWRYLLRLLPSFGIWGRQAVCEVAQEVWLTVHRRVHSFDPAVHRTPRAWLTGITWRCAANYRRAWQRRNRLFSEDPEAVLGALAAPGLNPEEAALLRTLEQAVPDEDQRQAFLLQACHGLTVAEIAAVQGVSETRMERRLTMARKHLQGDGEEADEPKLGAFLGFGSLEALAEALRPKRPIPDEVGAELWQRIEERIRQQGNGDAHPDDEPQSGPSSSHPPVAAAPAPAPAGQGAATLALTKGTLAILLAGAFVTGNVTGAAWQASRAEDAPEVITLEIPRPFAARGGAAAREGAPAAAAGPALAASHDPVTPPAARPAARASLRTARSQTGTAAILAAGAMPSARASGTAAPPAARSSPGSAVASKLLILQMRRAADAGNDPLVLALADEHARRFDARQAAERETERIRALRRLGRMAEAERRARDEAAASPERRGAMERAVRHPLP